MFKPTADPNREVMVMPKTELQRIVALEATVKRLLERVQKLERQSQGDEG